MDKKLPKHHHMVIYTKLQVKHIQNMLEIQYHIHQSKTDIRESMMVTTHCSREMVHHDEVNEIYLTWIAMSTLSMCIAWISDRSYFMENSEIFSHQQFEKISKARGNGSSGGV
eukprot:94486_1